MLRFIENHAVPKPTLRRMKRVVDSKVNDIGEWKGGDELINPILKLILTQGDILCIESGQGMPKAEMSKNRYPHMTFLYNTDGIEQLLNFFDCIQAEYTEGTKAVSQQVLFHNHIVEGAVTPVVTWRWLNKDFTYTGHVNFFMTILRAFEKAYKKTLFSGMCENELRFILNTRIQQQKQNSLDNGDKTTDWSTQHQFERR